MKFGTLQPLRTMVVIVPLKTILEARAEAFERLDQHAPSSTVLFGYILLDYILTPPTARPAVSDCVRSFWNLFEETQSQVPLTLEFPDVLLDMVEASFKDALPLVTEIFERFSRQVGIDQNSNFLTGCLLPFSGYDIAMQITAPVVT